MESIRLRAHAKINLTLDVVGKRPDGYHDVEMIMQSVGLWDEIILRDRQGYRAGQQSQEPAPRQQKYSLAGCGAYKDRVWNFPGC